MKAAMVAAESKEENMRILTQGELTRFTRIELMALLRRVAGEPPGLPESSIELRNAHANLRNIRIALARPEFRLR